MRRPRSSSAPASTITRRLSGARAVMLRACVAISASGRRPRRPSAHPPAAAMASTNGTPIAEAFDERAPLLLDFTHRRGDRDGKRLPAAARVPERDPPLRPVVAADHRASSGPRRGRPRAAMGSAAGIGRVAAPVASSTATTRSRLAHDRSPSPRAACASVRCSASSPATTLAAVRLRASRDSSDCFEREAPVQRKDGGAERGRRPAAAGPNTRASAASGGKGSRLYSS